MRGREGGIDGWTVEEEEKRCLAFAYRDDTSVQKGRNLKKTRKRRLAAHHQISFYSPFPPPPSFFWYLPSVGSLTSHANLPPYSITHRTEKRGNRPTSDTTNRNKQIVDEYVYLLQGKEKEGKTHGNHRAQVKQEKASATITTTTKKQLGPSVSYFYIQYIDAELSETNADGWCLAYELTCMSMCVYALLHLDNACTLCCSALFSSLFFPPSLFYRLFLACRSTDMVPGSWPLYFICIYIDFFLFPFFVSFLFFWRLVFRYQ